MKEDIDIKKVLENFKDLSASKQMEDIMLDAYKPQEEGTDEEWVENCKRSSADTVKGAEEAVKWLDDNDPDWSQGAYQAQQDKKKPTLEQVVWVFEKLTEACKRGGVSYRYLIYDLMGFSSEAYAPLQFAGALEVNNMIADFCDQEGCKPITQGNPESIQFLCSQCSFPENDTLTMDMKYCWNCGCRLDWREWNEK